MTCNKCGFSFAQNNCPQSDDSPHGSAGPCNQAGEDCSNFGEVSVRAQNFRDIINIRIDKLRATADRLEELSRSLPLELSPSADRALIELLRSCS